MVTGGSTASVVRRAAFAHRHGRRGAGRHRVARERTVGGVLRLVELRDVEPALDREARQQVVAAARLANRGSQCGHQRFAFAGGDHVGERGQRLRVHEGHRSANDDERMARVRSAA